MPRSAIVLMSVPSATVAIGDRAERAMAKHVAEFEVVGPWSLDTSRRFWEGFTPPALAGQPAGVGLRTGFFAGGDWRSANAGVPQSGGTPGVRVRGDRDLGGARPQGGPVMAPH